MKTLNVIFLLTFLMLSVSMVTGAQPPAITNINTVEGLQIFVPQFTSVKYNTSFNVEVHVSNISNGVQYPNDEVDCYLHLYNSTGSHILESSAFEKDANGWDLEYMVSYGNLTEHGEENVYYLWCNNTAENLGGEVKGFYEITANGKPTPDGFIIIGFSILLLFIFVFLTVYLVRAVGLIVDATFDILDIAYAWGLYFGLLGANLLATIYLGNVIILNFLELLIVVLAFPFMVVPVLAFILSMFRENKKVREKKAEW